MDSCFTIEHLVESRPTGETFLVKQYKKTAKNEEGVDIMKTEFLMVFKLDDEGNAVYTQDMGDLAMFLSMSEPFCVPASFFPGSMYRNNVIIYDYDEMGIVDVSDIPFYLHSVSGPHSVPYQIPPQDIENCFACFLWRNPSLETIYFWTIYPNSFEISLILRILW